MKGYAGTWRITEMEEWDKQYIDMEIKAYIQIDKKGYGSFQFAVVSGSINGKWMSSAAKNVLHLPGREMKNMIKFQGVAG